MNRDTYFSKKITVINFILSISIVILHANCSDLLNSNIIYLEKLFNFIRIITDAAVPTFFIISAYLLYKNYDIKNYLRKLKRRISSNVVPYIIWSAFFLTCFLILDNIPIIGEIVNSSIEYSLSGIFKYLLLAKSDPPLWFLRTLFEFVIISPIIYLLVRKNKVFGWIFFMIALIINGIIKFSYTELTSILFWMPIFIAGCNLSFHYFKIENVQRVDKRISYACLFILFIIGISLLNISDKSFIYYLYRMISPIAIWNIIDLFDINKLSESKYVNYSFFIFCCHYPVIFVVKKILSKVIGISTIGVLIIYIFTIIVSLIIILCLAFILKKYFNKIWNIINGNR